MEQFQLDKEQTRDFIIKIAPEYVEILRDLQSRGGWVKMPEKFETIFRRLNLDNYVLLYDDERFIGVSLALFLLGEQGYKEFNAEIAAIPAEEQMAFAKECLAGIMDEKSWDWIDDFLPDTPEKEEAARALFLALNEDEQREAIKRAGFFWGFFFAGFYNYLSLMLHGQKLTVLVAQAKAGNVESFGKAVSIEPRLLVSHPFFRERYTKARDSNETDFLKRIGYRLANPGAPGKIRYPGLYLVFAMLEAAGWLDHGFTHSQILDICDEAGLDRYQNRIEDTNFLTKRLIEYRKNRKSG